MKTLPHDTVPNSIGNGLTKLEYISGIALGSLLSKYSLNTPEDQKTVAKLAVELAIELIRQLNVNDI